MLIERLINHKIKIYYFMDIIIERTTEALSGLIVINNDRFEGYKKQWNRLKRKI